MRAQYAPTARQNRGRRTRKSADVNWPLAVADGRIALGTIDKIDDVFIAIDTRGVTLGEFSTLSEAVRIFPTGATDDQTSPAANFIKPRPARRTSPPATSPIPKTRHGLASVMNIQPAEEILP